MPEIMIAARAGLVVLDGTRRMVRKGVTTAHADHPIVTDHPKLWKPLQVDYPSGGAARSAGRRPRPSGDGQPVVDNAAVRAWAAEQGVDVAPYGRIPAPIIAEYLAAQSDPVQPQNEPGQQPITPVEPTAPNGPAAPAEVVPDGGR